MRCSAPAPFSSGDLRRIDLGAEAWVALMGTSHPLAGIGPLSADHLHGQRTAVTGHRDGAATTAQLPRCWTISASPADLFPGAPGPALHGSVVAGDAIALTTAPQNLRPGVLVRPLDPRRTLPFNLLWRDETPSAALSEFVRIAAATAARRPANLRPLAAVA